MSDKSPVVFVSGGCHFAPHSWAARALYAALSDLIPPRYRGAAPQRGAILCSLLETYTPTAVMQWQAAHGCDVVWHTCQTMPPVSDSPAVRTVQHAPIPGVGRTRIAQRRITAHTMALIDAVERGASIVQILSLNSPSVQHAQAVLRVANIDRLLITDDSSTHFNVKRKAG